MAQTNPLPSIKRNITTHGPDGKAIFTTNTNLSDELQWQIITPTKSFGLAYTTSTFPTNLQNDLDITHYQSYTRDPPGLTLPGGTVLRYVDYGPGVVSGIHRTMSIDYGIVIEGEIELLLDSGEKRLMKRGHCSVVRATRHGWRNPSERDWCRVVFVLLDVKPPVVDGEEVGEDYGGAMPGVKASS